MSSHYILEKLMLLFQLIVFIELYKELYSKNTTEYNIR